MRAPRIVRKRGVARAAAAAAAVAVVAGGALGAAIATAETPDEPATLARKTSLSVAAGKRLDAAASASALQRGEFIPGRGKANSRRARLGGGDEVIAALTGSLVPVAVESRDGSVVAYSAWRQIAKIDHDAPGQGLETGQPVGIPSVRVYDGASGRDRLVATGAHSPALSRSGRLAFVRADAETVRANEPYTGNVVVGSVDGGRFDAWTTESARYFPYAWAGDTLLVYNAVPQSEATDVYAYTGPGAGRLLAAGAFIVALSPDGERILVTVGRRMVQVVRVSDGAIEASMPLDGDGVATEDSPTTPHYLMFSGSWRGDRVVANSDLGLVVLNVADGLRIESILATPQFPHGVVEPTFTADARVIGWADLAGGDRPVGANAEPAWDHALVSCDLAAASCTIGEAQPARSWTRWIGNPSR